MLNTIILTFLFLFLRSTTTLAIPTPTYYDIIIYGATPSSVLSAIAASDEGANVALIDPRSWVGGAMTGGLAVTDIGTTSSVIGGRTRKFFDAVTSHYASTKPLYDFEPHVAEKIFWWLLNSTNVSVQLNTRIISLSKNIESLRITTAQLDNGNSISARMWVDASYEGFLLPLASVSFAMWKQVGARYACAP